MNKRKLENQIRSTVDITNLRDYYRIFELDFFTVNNISLKGPAGGGFLSGLMKKGWVEKQGKTKDEKILFSWKVDRHLLKRLFKKVFIYPMEVYDKTVEKMGGEI